VNAQEIIRRARGAAIAVMVLALATGAANAVEQKNQGPRNALQGFSENRDQPVKMQAAALEGREKE